jgi:hypothetical protein
MATGSLIFAASVDEARAVVTVDVTGFRDLAAEAAKRGTPGFGLVLVLPRRFWPPEKSGAVVIALDRLLRELPGDYDLIALGGEHWLQPPS